MMIADVGKNACLACSKPDDDRICPQNTMTKKE